MVKGYSKPNILIVDDQPENIEILATLLKDKFTPMAVTSGSKALEHAAGGNKPDMILLDIMMPEMDGIEVCRRLKADKRTDDIPVIFITALSEAEDEARGFKGTGNMELVLDRHIADKRIFPAIDLNRSSTRKEELLLSAQELNRVYLLRNFLSDMPSAEAIEFLMERMKRVTTNQEFLDSMAEGA